MDKTKKNDLEITGRTRVKRQPKRAPYNKDLIYEILDETFICNIAFSAGGQLHNIPTIYGRADDKIFIHGSEKNRMLGSFNSGGDICISVSITDGLVLAR